MYNNRQKDPGFGFVILLLKGLITGKPVFRKRNDLDNLGNLQSGNSYDSESGKQNVTLKSDFPNNSEHEFQNIHKDNSLEDAINNQTNVIDNITLDPPPTPEEYHEALMNP